MDLPRTSYRAESMKMQDLSLGGRSRVKALVIGRRVVAAEDNGPGIVEQHIQARLSAGERIGINEHQTVERIRSLTKTFAHLPTWDGLEGIGLSFRGLTVFRSCRVINHRRRWQGIC